MEDNLTNIEMISIFLKDMHYCVAPNGKIYTRKTKSGKIASNGFWREVVRYHKTGYLEIYYKKKHLFAHRIVYAKYNGELIEGLTINHEDGNIVNNNPNNLVQMTQADNNLHSFRVLNRKPSGNRKINYTIANNIREDRKKGNSYKDLIAKYNLSKTNISYIVNNKIWNDEK